VKFSDIAVKVLAAKECGLIKTNAHFWKEFSERKKFEKIISENADFKNAIERISNDLDSYDHKGGMVCIFDGYFPVINRKVKNDGDKPYLLFYKGNLSLLDDLNKNVAVIGLLDPDKDIIERETKIVKKLVCGESGSNEFVIVSGLATGCDTIAHKVCIENSGKTIAVLSTQISKIYPKENSNLAEEIIDKDGLLLTEYYKEPVHKNEFVKRLIERDRLQAMFAKAIILVASYRKGDGDCGSRHAMEAAKKYGIERFVIYNSKTDENNKRFGLNRDFLYSNDENNVKPLTAKSIKDINSLNNPDLTKRQSSNCVQQTFEYA
jgi:DNA processing protein